MVISVYRLHCDHVYANYTPELEDRHFANHCPDAPETLKEAARARLVKRGCAIRALVAPLGERLSAIAAEDRSGQSRASSSGRSGCK